MKKILKTMVLSACVLLCTSIFAACGLFGEGGNGANGNDTQTPKSVTITLVTNGGTTPKLTIIGEAGSDMELPIPVRENYTFDAWYNDWSIISNTVFPDTDMTLTARYYVDEDNERTINSIPTELNKVYDTNISWNQSNFSAADWQSVGYLKKNITTEINATVTLERKASTFFGGSVWFVLTGSSREDVIATSPKLYNDEAYEDFSLSAAAQAKILVGSTSTIIILHKDSDLGSQHLRFRNINLSITYIEKAGTLV